MAKTDRTDIAIRCLGPGDIDILCATAEGLFDCPVRRDQATAFLNDPQHILVAAFDGPEMVSFASGTVTLHPDKPPALFINEVGTRDSHLRRGLATLVTQDLMARARARGCSGGMWLGTEPGNVAALALYRKLGGDEVVFVGFGWDGAFDDDG